MVPLHLSSPTRRHRDVEKVGRQTDGQKKDQVEEKVVAVKLDSGSRSGGSCRDELGPNPSLFVRKRENTWF